jgi:uncharacterized protein
MIDAGQGYREPWTPSRTRHPWRWSQDDPREVARQGFEALMSGESSVVAGSVRNRLQAEVATHLPDAVAAPMQARMTKPQE